MVFKPEGKQINNPPSDADKLTKEISDLKQANNNILQFTFGIIDTLESQGKSLVSAGNSLFVISNRLREIVQQSARNEGQQN